MRRGIAAALALPLAACVAQTEAGPPLNAAERHRAWVCQHAGEVQFGITTALLLAEKIRDNDARAAAIAAANAEQAVVDSCGVAP